MSSTARAPGDRTSRWLALRIDRSFIDDHFAPSAEAFGTWVNAHAEANTVVLEIGAAEAIEALQANT